MNQLNLLYKNIVNKTIQNNLSIYKQIVIKIVMTLINNKWNQQTQWQK